MNWDWEKLQQKRQRQSGGGGGGGPDFDFNEQLKKLKGLKLPGGGKLLILGLIILWLASGIYIVEPDEAGVVQRFGAYAYQTGPGAHYHLPFPIETVTTPKTSEVRRAEVGFRSSERDPDQVRGVPDEALMLTGDENIVSVQFIVQYQLKDPVAYLFNLSQQTETVKNAAEAAMREVVGYNKIDSALTTGKLEIQNDTRDLLQEILDIYSSGIQVVAVQLQDVHPPDEVIDAFKDVASAREDKSRFINEAEAYRNDLLPKARGEAATIINAAQGYKESTILRAKGEAARFNEVLAEYRKAKDVTRRRLYIETMEKVFANPNLEKVIMTDKASGRVVPYLPLDRLSGGRAKEGAN
jgi:membrane protease subunit HflK